MPPRPSALEKFQQNLDRTYGAGRVVTASSPYVVCPTGSLTLDLALRRPGSRLGGWTVGRIHEVVGNPDVGKSTLVINSMREHQAMFPDKSVAYIDMEGTFDDEWAIANGLDISRARFEHMFPDNSEDASDMVRQCCRSGLYSIAVVDSIGGMESRKAFEDSGGGIKDAGDDIVGRNAQVITRMVKHLASLARQAHVTVILVNQHRQVISKFGGKKSAGPTALQHATTTRVEMSRTGEDPVTLLIDGVRQPVSVQSRARVARSKIVPPGGVAEFWINNRLTEDFGPPGINRIDECAEVGISTGAIRQNGSWYQVPGAPKVRSRAAVIDQLRAQPELMAAVREKIFASVPD